MRLFTGLVFLFLCISTTSAVTYRVGPGWEYAELDEVPWQLLLPGDTVNMYYRSQPYRGKMVICRIGAQGFPIVVRGVPGENGELPVIDGNNATTSTALNYWNEERGIIKIGGANKPADTTPEWIRIELLEIRNARPGFTFTGRDGRKEYASNAAAVYIEKGRHITISGCILHDCGNGIFAGHPTEDLLIEYCWIYNNGIEGSPYEHNTYTETNGIIYQYNHFSSLREGCLGNNLKDRSAGTVIRYNWIENGNRQLDLVDSGHEDFYTNPIYRTTYVYANILIEADGEGNSQIIHYGGDSGDETRYRKGTLYLYNNTIVSTRSGNTTLLRMPTEFESCRAINNIIHVTAAPSNLAVVSTDNGVMTMENNFMRPGWVLAHGSTLAQTDIQRTVEAGEPGFTDLDAQDFTLSENSPCLNAGMEPPAEIVSIYTPVEEYVKHTDSRIRPPAGRIDIGAYERELPTAVTIPELLTDLRVAVAPNPFRHSVQFTVWGALRVSVYSVEGKLVMDLYAAANVSQGPVALSWTPEADVPAGVYFIRVSNGTEVLTRQVQFIR